MNLVRLTAVALALSSLPALAQGEPIVLETTAQAELPINNGGAFDWDGFYAGVYGVAAARPDSGLSAGIGLNLGYARTFDFVLVGGEVALQTAGNDVADSSYLQAVGRGGVLVTDNVLLFGAGGFGADLRPGETGHLLAGGGVEIGVTESLSLRGQFLHGFPVTNTAPVEHVTVGAQFHF